MSQGCDLLSTDLECQYDVKMNRLSSFYNVKLNCFSNKCVSQHLLDAFSFTLRLLTVGLSSVCR